MILNEILPEPEYKCVSLSNNYEVCHKEDTKASKPAFLCSASIQYNRTIKHFVLVHVNRYGTLQLAAIKMISCV